MNACSTIIIIIELVWCKIKFCCLETCWRKKM